MKNYLIAGVATLLIQASFAQKKCNTENPVTGQEWTVESESRSLQEFPTFDGTFQIKMANEDYFAFSSNFLELIELSRKENEDVVLELGDNRSVIITSRIKVSAPEFEPFTSPYLIVQ